MTSESNEPAWYAVRFHKKKSAAAVPFVPSAKKRPKKKKNSRQRRQSQQLVSESRFVPYSEYLRSAWWQKKRKQKLDSVGSRCNRCGGRAFLQVHHLHYRSLWREKNADLEVLCRTCHETEHECLVQADSHLRSINNVPD